MQNQFTSISNRGILLSKTIISLVITGLIIFFISLILSVLLSFKNEIYLSTTQRVILVSFSLIPLIITLYTFFIFESIYPKRCFSNNVFIKLFLFLFYLFIPATAIVFRYDGFISKGLTLINFIPFILLVLSPFVDFKKMNIINVVIDILFNTWKNVPFSINTNYFSHPQISNDRMIEYTNMETLKKFQESFIKSSCEDILISQKVRSTNFLEKTTIKEILDIGGYDGAFTMKLLSELSIKDVNIKLIDPVKISDYNNNVTSICKTVDYEQIKFEDFAPDTNMKFDLILASHSLYSFLDKDEKNIEQLTSKILKLLKPNGLLIVILGSSKSPAYNYKNNITKYILNFSNNDMNAEKYISHLQQNDNIHYSYTIIDNYINLTDLISNDELFSQWTSYFARIPIIKDSYLIKQMKNIALYYSMKPNEYPECVNTLNKNDSNIDYLLHKTVGILISTTANNVYKSLGKSS